MKKPFATKRRRSPPEPTFFTDRDLGKTFPQILRQSGLVIERYCDHFQERNATDNEWLLFAARRGWIGISHDDNIRGDSEAVRTVMENKGRLLIVRGALPHPALAELFVAALSSVHRLIERQAGSAFIASIRRSVGRGGVSSTGVHLLLTFEEWRLRDRGGRR